MTGMQHVGELRPHFYADHRRLARALRWRRRCRQYIAAVSTALAASAQFFAQFGFCVVEGLNNALLIMMPGRALRFRV
jgi:hypothetical protein